MFHKASELGKADPQSVATAIEASGPEPIHIIRNAVGKEAWKPFQRIVMQGMMMKAGYGTEKGLQGEQWLKTMFEKGPGAEAKMKAIFDPQIISNMKKFAEALQVMQSQRGAKEGTMWIQLAQATALGAFAFGTGAVKGGSLTILMMPPVLAFVMTHPRLAHWLTQGMQMPAGSKEGITLLSKVLAAVPQTLYSAPVVRPSTTEVSPTGTIRPFALER